MIDKFQPDLVLGTGGYICGPVFYALFLIYLIL